MPIIDCGIDIGSTNLKVLLLDESGNTLFVRALPTPRSADDFGVVTDALALVGVLEALIIEGWRAVGAGRPLRSLAVAGIGEDGLGVDHHLRPLGPAIPWFDRRAIAESDELQRFASLQPRAGIAIDPTRTAAKWLWLKRHRPQQINPAAAWITLTDFPAVWWSGKPFMSISLAPRTGCFDVHGRTWISDLLDGCGAPPLPGVLGAAQIVGGVRPGPLRESGAADAGTLVVAGGHDHPVAASVIRRFDQRARVDSLGTANLLYGESPAAAGFRPAAGLALSIPPSGKAGAACLGVIELATEMDRRGISAEEMRRFLAQPTLPAAPLPSIAALGDLAVPKEIAVRRCLEAACLGSRSMLVAFGAAGVPAGPIYATGGWSRSRVFTALRASVFGEPLHALGELELTAIGAALCGTEAATGTAASPITAGDITTIDPHEDWAVHYDRLFAASRAA
jgi:xylulokinase